jgi:hypothetical protein
LRLRQAAEVASINPRPAPARHETGEKHVGGIARVTGKEVARETGLSAAQAEVVFYRSLAIEREDIIEWDLVRVEKQTIEGVRVALSACAFRERCRTNQGGETTGKNRREPHVRPIRPLLWLDLDTIANGHI